MNPASTRLLYALLGLGLTTSALARISTESPFVPKNGQITSAPTENSPIELRGVMATPDGLRFGIYEPASQKGNWVKADEAGFGYVVKSYDANKSMVSVEYQGRVQTLTLKEAKFDGTGAAAAVPNLASGPQVRPAVQPGQPAAAPNQVEEAKRLEQVASEVRRRRAARQAATTTQPAAPAPATTTTGTP
jgi:hypothetical protein